MAAAEALFSVDSHYAAAILRHRDQINLRMIILHWSRRASMNYLQVSDSIETNDFAGISARRCRAGPRPVPTTGREKSVLRRLLGKAESLANEPGGAEIAGLFQARREALAPASNRLRELSERGELGQALDALCALFVHLHVNRMGGSPAAEQRMLSLLLRTREGLKKSPVVRP